MKNLFIALIISVLQPFFVFAQQPQFEKGVQKLEYSLSDDKVSIFSRNIFPPLLLEFKKIKPESLIKNTIEQYKKLDLEIDETKPKTVVLTVYFGEKGIKIGDVLSQKIEVRQQKNATETFGILKSSEVVKLKTGRDSLIFNYVYYSLPSEYENQVTPAMKIFPKEGHTLMFGFTIDNLIDFLTYDYTNVNNHFISITRLDNMIFKQKRNENSNKVIVEKYDSTKYINRKIRPILSLISFEDVKKREQNKAKSHIITLSKIEQNIINEVVATANFGAGWLNNSFVPSFHFGLYAGRGKLLYGLVLDQFYMQDGSFEVKNLPTINEGVFTGISVRLYDLIPSSSIDKPKRTYLGSFTLAKNVSGDGSLIPYYNRNTFKVSGTLPLLKHLSVEPEMYLNRKFKNESFGIRFLIH